jgi:sulfur-carrier protein
MQDPVSLKASVPLISVAIPDALRTFCSNSGASRPAELCVAASSVREVLEELARLHPQVYVRLCDERGQPRPHINVFVNDDHVRAREGLETLLTAGDQVTILPAVSGG